MRNDRHVTDVGRLFHESTDLEQIVNIMNAIRSLGSE